MVEALDVVCRVLNWEKGTNEETQRITSSRDLLINEATLVVFGSLMVMPLPHGTTLKSFTNVVNSKVLVEAIEKEATPVNTLKAPALCMVNEVIDDAMRDLDVFFHEKKAIGGSP